MAALPYDVTSNLPEGEVGSSKAYNDTLNALTSSSASNEMAPRLDITPFADINKRGQVSSVGGYVEARSLASVMEEARAVAEIENNMPMISGLASHIRKCWEEAKRAKQNTVEKRMLQSLRQRNGEYDPDVLARLRGQTQNPVYMLITSNKCRAASAWIREAVAGMPWSCKPTPVSDIDEVTKVEIQQAAEAEIFKFNMMGIFPTNAQVKEFMLALRDQAFAKIQETAKARAERMTEKMKDQLFEGGFQDAIDAFIDDLVTFPAAFIKGPVIRVRPQLKWILDQRTGRTAVDVQDSYKLEWERVDPFNIYPAPDATTIDDGYLIERHRLSRSDLVSMKNVEGYSPDAINTVLDEYGRGGLHDWLQVDGDRAYAERRDSSSFADNPSELIDALQFWGSVQGKMLIDWGVPEEQVADAMAEYHVECWLVGNWVIKATINPDKLNRKPYYKASWENIPGQFWGNSIPDLCRDTQAMCNAAARSIANNMSLSSGPQVAIDISKIPKGENITEMYPWKIWQFADNGLAPSNMQPISFFQPSSNVQELMAIYEKFATLTDEYTGIPRYMTGDSRVGGAGSTASGMSMLMSNAGKTIKNVVANIDRILKPAIERLYYYNFLYLDDPELKGDVSIVAEGAEAMMLKQAQQQRQLEAFNMVASNPMVANMVGPEGMAYMLRQLIKQLGMDTDRIIPDTPILKARMAEQQLQAVQAYQQQMAMQQQAQGQPQAGGSRASPGNGMDQRRLMDGTPQSVAQLKPPVGQ